MQKFQCFLCVEAVIYVLLYSLHNCTFKPLGYNVLKYLSYLMLVSWTIIFTFQTKVNDEKENVS